MNADNVGSNDNNNNDDGDVLYLRNSIDVYLGRIYTACVCITLASTAVLFLIFKLSHDTYPRWLYNISGIIDITIMLAWLHIVHNSTLLLTLRTKILLATTITLILVVIPMTIYFLIDALQFCDIPTLTYAGLHIIHVVLLVLSSLSAYAAMQVEDNIASDLSLSPTTITATTTTTTTSTL